MTDETIAKRGNQELRKLSPEWMPWTHQILTWSDGENYGYPGQNKLIVTGQSNFETEDAAFKAFDRVRTDER